MGRTACTESQFLYKGALYLTVELYLYSPYGPYGLYRVSVPVQGVHLRDRRYQGVCGRWLAGNESLTGRLSRVDIVCCQHDAS